MANLASTNIFGSLTVADFIKADTVFEDRVPLYQKYLGIDSKAVDSDKLDGLHSSSFLRRDTTSTLNAVIHGSDGQPLLQVFEGNQAYLGSTGRSHVTLAAANSPRYRNAAGTYYTIWNASNSNTTSYDWAAKNITASGSISAGTASVSTFGGTGGNQARIIINTANAGSPQIGFTENGDMSWAIGGDDGDNSFKIHGVVGSTIPTINNLSVPFFEIKTNGYVGIGVDPTAKLHVGGSFKATTGSFSSTLTIEGTNPHIKFAPAGANDYAGIRFNYSNNDGVLEFWTSDDYNEAFVWRAYDTGSDGTGAYQEWMKLVSKKLYVDGKLAVLTDDSRLSNSRPASDVYSWAKASSKPSYSYSEVGAAAYEGRVVTDVNAYFTKSSGFYGVSGTAANTPEGSYQTLIVARNSDVGFHLLGGYTTDDLWYRGWASSGSSVYSWRRLWHSGNFDPNTKLDKTAKAADSDRLDGIDSGSFLRSNASDTFTGKLSVGSSSARSAGMYGIYDSHKIGHIWSMSTGYAIPDTGANFGSLYGMAYKHTNNTAGGTMAGGHQIVFCNAGSPGSAIGLNGNIWTKGTIYESGQALSSRYSPIGHNHGEATSGDYGPARLAQTSHIISEFTRLNGLWTIEEQYDVLDISGWATGWSNSSRKNADSGYQRMPGGITIAWGKFTASDSGWVYFHPEAFTTCFAVSILGGTGLIRAEILSGHNGFYWVECQEHITTAKPCYYIAIGQKD